MGRGRLANEQQPEDILCRCIDLMPGISGCDMEKDTLPKATKDIHQSETEPPRTVVCDYQTYTQLNADNRPKIAISACYLLNILEIMLKSV